MPTIVKISMDASEYNKQLDEVMARTRAAQEKMAAVTVPSASGMPQSAAGVSAASAGSAQNISVSAEVSGLEDVQKLSEAVRALPSEKEVRIAATVDSGGLSKAREKAKEVSCGMIQISKDTEKVNDKNKSISTGIQNFGQRAKAALKDFKSDLLSGNSALSQLKGGILSLLNPWSLVIAAAGALLTVGKEVWANSGAVFLFCGFTVSAYCRKVNLPAFHSFLFFRFQASSVFKLRSSKIPRPLRYSSGVALKYFLNSAMKKLVFL